MRFPWVVLVFTGVFVALIYLPNRLNPLAPFDPNAPPTAITPLQLYRTVSNRESCLAALQNAQSLHYTHFDDLDVSPQCHIRNRVKVNHIASANLRPVETSCETALRLYMWNRYVVQPAANNHFGQTVDEIQHFDSFSCRRIRTPQGQGGSMSAHATASAIDISGFRLSDGQVLKVIDSANAQAFWDEVRDGACTWFRTVLSAEYNDLHRDHFHLESGRWSTCR